jgi:hypothetical protein
MEGLLAKIIPSIGHADAQRKPDIPGLVWFDTRYISSYTEVRNKDRILEAAGNIFQFFCEHCTKQRSIVKNKKKIMSELDEAIGEISEEDKQKEERKKNYIDILKSVTKNSFSDYDKNTWFDEAVSYKPKGESVATSSQPPKSHLLNFQKWSIF